MQYDKCKILHFQKISKKIGTVCNWSVAALMLDLQLYIFTCVFVYFVSVCLDGYPRHWGFLSKNHVLFIYTKM